ncbi:MAG: Holliday junction branch migration protein RuvA [Endozoicomonadaceae bacterium]|nr:Holliday junction branch migration protein RuvA [Endozoicomonadaceae bacterium]
MIARLIGRILDIQPPFVIIETHGVGYELESPLTTLTKLKNNQDCTLYTHLIVREDAQLLYGFLLQSERDLFRDLIKINGIGAKAALNILSTFDVATLIQCIQNQNIDMLTKVPGIGQKTASRLLIDLQGTLKKWQLKTSIPLSSITSGNMTIESTTQHDVVSALISLGYKSYEASKAIQSIQKRQSLSREELLKQALNAML